MIWVIDVENDSIPGQGKRFHSWIGKTIPFLDRKAISKLGIVLTEK
jgi:hypothetical protein